MTNMMARFLKPAAPVEAPTPAPVVPPTTENQQVKRGVGRPKNTKKTEVQTTTIRLDPDDHLAVRQLALRDRMAMNELVFVALKDYCARRGVKLEGPSK